MINILNTASGMINRFLQRAHKFIIHQLFNRSNTHFQSLSTSLNKSQTNRIKSCGGGLKAELIPTSPDLMTTRAADHPCGGEEYGTPRNLARLTTELHGADAL